MLEIGLNFGDCFSYALAKATREPQLFKGEGPVRSVLGLDKNHHLCL